MVRTVAQLEALYGEPVPGSITKQVDHLTPLHQEYVHTLLLPDRRGNNRLDTLRNLIADPRIGLLFLVPGVGVTLRVNGTAELSTDEQLRHRFTIGDKAPVTVIVVSTTSVYTQCPKALIRSHLWEPANHRGPPRTAHGGPDHGGDHGRRGRWQGLRRRLSGAHPPDHLLTPRPTPSMN